MHEFVSSARGSKHYNVRGSFDRRSRNHADKTEIKQSLRVVPSGHLLAAWMESVLLVLSLSPSTHIRRGWRMKTMLSQGYATVTCFGAFKG